MSSRPQASPVTPEQRAKQYELEQRLRTEILASTPSTRGEVTRIAYDRLYREAPWHPDIRRTPESRMARLVRTASLLGNHVRHAKRVLEVGCGSGDMMNFLANHYPQVQFTGVDISEVKLTSHTQQWPSNLSFQTADCVRPTGVGTGYDLVISEQLLEHLHPEDGPLHIGSIRKLIRPGGYFAIGTPNRWTGPHDVSAYFATTASGTHLREWSVGELTKTLKDAGFARVTTDIPLVAHLRRVLPVDGDIMTMPAGIKIAMERAFSRIPNKKLRTAFFRFARMDNIVVFAQTPLKRSSDSGEVAR